VFCSKRKTILPINFPTSQMNQSLQTEAERGRATNLLHLDTNCEVKSKSKINRFCLIRQLLSYEVHYSFSSRLPFKTSNKMSNVVFLAGKDASNLRWSDSQSEFGMCLLKSSTYYWLFGFRRPNYINFKNSIIYDYVMLIENWNHHEFLISYDFISNLWVVNFFAF
jgi:hypothetical protein